MRARDRARHDRDNLDLHAAYLAQVGIADPPGLVESAEQLGKVPARPRCSRWPQVGLTRGAGKLTGLRGWEVGPGGRQSPG